MVVMPTQVVKSYRGAYEKGSYLFDLFMIYSHQIDETWNFLTSKFSDIEIGSWSNPGRLINFSPQYVCKKLNWVSIHCTFQHS